MAKYHIAWRLDTSRLPDTPQEIAAGVSLLVGQVRKDLESGKLNEWGSYPGEWCGYAVLEGAEDDVNMLTLQYAPHVIFEVRPIVDAYETAEFLEKMSG